MRRRVSSLYIEMAEGWQRDGRGWQRVVEGGRGTVEGRQRDGRGRVVVVEGWQRDGRGMVEGRQRDGRGMVEGWQRKVGGGRGMVEESRGWYRYFHLKLQQQILLNMQVYFSGDTDVQKKPYITNRNSNNASKFPCRQHHFIHPVGKKNKNTKTYKNYVYINKKTN